MGQVRLLVFGLLLLVVLIVVGCKRETPVVSPEVPEEAKLVVALAIEDLADRLEILPDAIEVVEVMQVDWADTSLGCPEPRMMYAQVITPGFLIQLKVGEQVYDYHSSYTRVALCQR